MAYNKRINSICFITFLALFVYIYIIPITSATEEYRMVCAFDSDEAFGVEIIRKALEEKDHVKQTTYGDFYYNVVHKLLCFIENLTPITGKTIIIALRSVSCFFSFLSLVLLFFISKRITNIVWAPWLTIFAVSIAYTDFFFNATNAHPDSMQLTFILLALYVLMEAVKTNKIFYIFLSYLLVGLVFSTKFHGVFLLPLLAFVSILIIYRTKSSSFIILDLLSMISLSYFSYHTFDRNVLMHVDQTHPKLADFMSIIHLFHFIVVFVYIIKIITLIISYSNYKNKIICKINSFISLHSIGFFIAFFVVIHTSFEQTKNYNFILILLEFMDIITVGHWFSGEFAWYQWFGLISRIGVGSPVLSILCTYLFFVFIKQGFKETFNIERTVIWLWVVINVLYILFRVRAGFEHYVLPFMPLVWLLGMVGFIEYISAYKTLIQRVSTVVLLIILSPCVAQTLTIRKEFIEREESNVTKAGHWLVQNISKDQKIITDYYAYIPPVFSNYQECWGMDSIRVFSYNPDVIILTKLSNEFLDATKASRFIRGKSEDYLRVHFFYKNLMEGKFPYKQVKEMGDIRIFVRSK